jgi:zinc transport system substrate-binding protein/iron/zinc/copper transport system substrate-binding protein
MREYMILVFVPALSILLSVLFVTVSYGQTVVASTSLTAAIAKASGATEVRIITPVDVKHPPEYELKPSDLIKFDGAQAVVYGGYERMVSKLIETSGNKNIHTIKIDTTTSPENVILQSRKIAQILHTEKAQEVWEKMFNTRLMALKAMLSPLAGKRTIVAAHAQPFARWAGLDVIMVLNPGELSVKAVTEAVTKRPDLVVDILHMPTARVVADNSHARYVQVLNFPGMGGTVTLEDIFEFNTSQLLKAFGQ